MYDCPFCIWPSWNGLLIVRMPVLVVAGGWWVDDTGKLFILLFPLILLPIAVLYLLGVVSLLIGEYFDALPYPWFVYVECFSYDCLLLLLLAFNVYLVSI